MNREIKFRAWLKGDKIMCDVLEWRSVGKIGVVIQDSGPFLFPDKALEIMQYTGLKDKNGKEIYEGDIIKKHKSDVLPEEIGTVIWASVRCSFTVETVRKHYFDIGKCNRDIITDTSSDRDHRMEIIGNIYENPELLKEKG